MWNYIYLNELYHHGIKGQKWGVRRFQNADGSLTKLGQQRYYSDDERKDMASQAKKKVTSSFIHPHSSRDFSLEKVDDIREAGEFLRSQSTVITDNFNEYDKCVQKDLKSLKTNQKFLDDCKKYMKTADADDDIETLTYYAIDAVYDNMYKYESQDTKKAFQKFDKSVKDYYDNVKSITDDIVGEYGDQTVSSYTTSSGSVFIKKVTKHDVSYKEATENTLYKLGDAQWVRYLNNHSEMSYYDGAGADTTNELVKILVTDYTKK